MTKIEESLFALGKHLKKKAALGKYLTDKEIEQIKAKLIKTQAALDIGKELASPHAATKTSETEGKENKIYFGTPVIDDKRQTKIIDPILEEFERKRTKPLFWTLKHAEAIKAKTESPKRDKGIADAIIKYHKLKREIGASKSVKVEQRARLEKARTNLQKKLNANHIEVKFIF